MQHVTPWSTSDSETDSCVTYPGMLLGITEYLKHRIDSRNGSCPPWYYHDDEDKCSFSHQLPRIAGPAEPVWLVRPWPDQFLAL